MEIVGAGGGGSALVPKLGRYYQYFKDTYATNTGIDGDAYEPKNAARQDFDRLGNKAEVCVAHASGKFPNVTFVAVPEFLTEDNIDFCISEGDIVFLCVDNNKSRKLTDTYAGTLANVTIVCGGNDMTDGNVQIYVRKDGQDITESLSDVHPEIADPKDKSPHEMSCEEKAMESSPQLFFANDFVATLMCTVLYLIVEEGFLDKIPFGELYFDMQIGRVNPVHRIKNNNKEAK